MSQILENNVVSLLDRYPEYRSIIQSVGMANLNEKFEVRDSEAGGLQLWEGNHLVDDTRTEYLGSENRAGAVRVAVILGFGMGSILQSVLQKYSREVRDVMVIEPSWERFLYSLALTDFKGLFADTKIHWCIGQSRDQIFSKSYGLFRPTPRCFYVMNDIVVRNPHYEAQFSGYFDCAQDEWNAAKAMISRNYGSFEDSLLGLRNVLENRGFIESQPGIRHLRDAFSGKPAVVVATGPSLNRSLDLLKANQDRVLILSADASASILLQHGIEPHFVMSLERVMATKPLVEALKPYADGLRSQWVSYPLVPKGVIDEFPGDKWVVYRDQAYFSFLEDWIPKGMMRSGTSVAHMCCRFADWLGCGSVALIGQDLAYDPDRLSSHADGVACSEWSHDRSEQELKSKLAEEGQGDLLYIPGNKRPLVPTNPTYFSMLREYAWEVQQIKAKVINCTDGGARIDGLEWAEFSSFLSGLAPFDAFEKILELRKEFEADPDDQLALREVMDICGEFAKRLEQLLNEAKALEKAKNLSPGEHQQALDMLRKTSELFLENSHFVAFIGELNASKLIQVENQWFSHATTEASSKLRYRAITDWFQTNHEAAQQVHQTLKRVTASST